MTARLILLGGAVLLAAAHALPAASLGSVTGDAVNGNVMEVTAVLGTLAILGCEPVFNPKEAQRTAHWFKDGVHIATVTGETNAVLGNGTVPVRRRPLPQVGFLVLPRVLRADEGDYWCMRVDDGTLGEVTRLRVAYIEPLAKDSQLTMRPRRPRPGATVEVQCASTDAFPPPAIFWKKNGEPLPPDGRFEVAPNGSLLIHGVRAEDVGELACVLTNFAGRTAATVHLELSESSEDDLDTTVSACASDFLTESLLWLLLGAVSGAGLMLIYLFTGLICHRCRGSRPCTGQVPLWRALLCADPALAPGFRKAVAPMDSDIRPRLLESS